MRFMNITFKLFASLTDYLPADGRRSNQVALEVSPEASISQIIEPFGLPAKMVHLVLVNGKYIEPDKRLSTTLVEGDVLAIWPPIAGG
jgi:molybdopterin converting factor small subunit